MDVLHFRLFGRVRVARDDSAPEIKITRTAQTLLAYLLLHRSYNSRDVLTCLCWCDQPEDQARSCLNTALWRLRRVLEPDDVPRGTYLLTTAAGEVGFNWDSHHWLDVETFERAADQALAVPVQNLEAPQADALERALQLYTGELLEGFYDDWTLRERERLRGIYLDSLARLMRYHRRRGAHEASLHYGQQILRHEPLREETHREMMRLYAETGQRALAARQYEICRQILADELDIPPMEETQALYLQLFPGAREPRAHAPASKEPTPLALTHALQQLRQAMHDFDSARGELQRAVHLIERITAASSSEPTVRPG
jgi:DNA-binding SARP family transcriptional activator